MIYFPYLYFSASKQVYRPPSARGQATKTNFSLYDAEELGIGKTERE